MSIILGHRGASGHAPENTLEAFKLAMDMGAEGFELDVHLSKDGELVVIHDETVDRTTNGKGLVWEKTLAELKELDACNKMEAYRGAKIPTLREVYELIRDTDHRQRGDQDRRYLLPPDRGEVPGSGSRDGHEGPHRLLLLQPLHHQEGP